VNSSLIAGWLGEGARRVKHHETLVRASPERVYSATLDAPLQDMPLSRMLFTFRGIAFRTDMTVRELFTTPPFLLLAEQAPVEIVFGIGRRTGGRPLTTPAEFRGTLDPGAVRAVATFHLEPATGSVRLSSETWVETCGRRSRLLFAAYWLVVAPFSGLIRQELLATAKRRAERGN